MRKLFTLLALLMPLLGTAVRGYAQPNPDNTPLATDSVPDGLYYIASTSETLYSLTSPYIAAASTTAMKLVAKSDVTTTYDKTVGLWKITSQGNGTGSDGVKYYIQSMENSQYWSVSPTVPLGAARYYAIIYDSSNSCYKIQGHTNTSDIGNKTPVGATSATTFSRAESGNNTWKLIPAYTTQTKQEWTFRYTDDKGNAFTSTAAAFVGEPISSLTNLDYFTDIKDSDGKVVVEEGVTTYNISCKAAFPFEEGQFYTMKMRAASPITSGSCSVVWDTSSSTVSTRSSDSDIAKMGAYWRFERVANTQNQVRLISNAKGKPQYVYFADMGANESKASMGNTGTVFLIKPCNAGFRLCSTSSNTQNANDVDGNLGVWTDDHSATDEGSTFTIALAAEQPSPVTVTVTQDGETISTTGYTLSGYYWKAGESVTDGKFSIDSYYNIDTDNAAFAAGTPVKLTAAFPFKVSSKSGTKHWTLLRTRNDDTHICILNSDEGAMKTRGTNGNMEVQANVDMLTRFGQWAFVLKDGTPSQFYIVNRASGESKALKLASETQGTVATMTAIDSATPFHIAKQPDDFTKFTGGFTIQPNNTNNHAMGDHGNGNLTYWCARGSSELNDDGSIFRVYDITPATAAATVEKTNGTHTGLVGELNISSEKITELKAKTTTADFTDLYYTLLTSDDSYVKVSSDKYYRIWYKRNTRYPQNNLATADKDGKVSTEEASRKITTAASSDAAVSTPATISRFVETGTDGVWNIQNANSAFYWGSTCDSEGKDVELFAVENATYAGKYKVDYTTSGTVTELGLVDTGITTGEQPQYLNSFYSDIYTNASLTHWNGSRSAGLDAGNIVYIKEVTEYPVTFKAEYATLCLPFAVTVPAGVTAYKVTDATRTELVMEELTGEVPAGTGMILKGTEGETVNFPLAAASESTAGESSAVTDNKLTGVTVKREGVTAKSFYGLAKKNDHVAFYIANVTEMPANKAYLLTSACVASDPGELNELLEFNAGQPTGIAGTLSGAATDGSDTYYDLSGRRVLFPAKGVYVKGNGQKVYVK